MKLSYLKTLCVAGAFAALTSTPAHAVVTAWDWQGCGGGKFLTCASVHVAIVGTQIVLTVDNYGAYNPATDLTEAEASPSVFSELGLSGIGGTLTGLDSFNCLGGTAGTDTNCGWAFNGNITELSNLTGAPFGGAEATNPPSSNGLNAGAGGTYYRVTLTFNTTGTLDLANVIFGLHAIASVPGSCSTKYSVTRSGTSTGTVNNSTDPRDPNCFTDLGGPTEITPEPATMSLMALGLVGLVGAGAIRRRNKKV